MNAFVAELAKSSGRISGLATVFPGEEGARTILDEAFAMGLAGVKLHCHVQCFAPDADALHEVYEACEAHDRPLVMHAGREPASEGYACDAHVLCTADRVDRVLRDHPRLRLCVPHLGADEFDAYERLLERHDRLWLDTTMVVADYFPCPSPQRIVAARPDRIFYGTDFPNLPYAWDRELSRLAKAGFPEASLEQVLGGTAKAFFRIPPA
jgi:predicted TIM-barrel fold metal-dependent hydrolase